MLDIDAAGTLVAGALDADPARRSLPMSRY
jgi:hypothetical protein